MSGQEFSCRSMHNSGLAAWESLGEVSSWLLKPIYPRHKDPFAARPALTVDVPFSLALSDRIISSSLSEYRAPFTLIFEEARSISRRSSGVSSTEAVPIRESRRLSCYFTFALLHCFSFEARRSMGFHYRKCEAGLEAVSPLLAHASTAVALIALHAALLAVCSPIDS
jgi:hypothetical protein